MRLFYITHTKFTGTAKLIYGLNGQLTQLDISGCTMHPGVLMAFKSAIPATVQALEAGEGFTADAKIVEGDFEITFDMFWQAYDNKINRARCLQLWERLSKTQQVLAWHGIAAYDAYLKANEWRKKADPETYLKKQYWQNEWK